MATRLLIAASIASTALALDNGLGLTPALAWSSWNYFNFDINGTLIREIGAALVATGLADLGFRQVNIDAGYLNRNRSATGELVVNPSKFPRGMRALSDDLAQKYSLGLGVYTDITNRSCSDIAPNVGGPGSLGHYDQDAATLKAWNVSYLKVDMCSVDIGIDPAHQLEHWSALRDALNATGHPIYYSICPHATVPATGPSAPWATKHVYSPPRSWNKTTRSGLANSLLTEFTNLFDMWYAPHWRSFADPCPGPRCNSTGPGGLLTNIDAMVVMSKPEYSGVGSWADGDMLQVCNYGEGGARAGSGNGGMTLREYATSLSIWAILASPIIISSDVRRLEAEHPECLAMLLGSGEIIAISQDALGKAGVLVHQATNATTSSDSVATTLNIVEQIWARSLVGGEVAVVLFNRDEVERTMVFTRAMMQHVLESDSVFTVRDAWARVDVGEVTMHGGDGGNVSAVVQPHEAKVIVLHHRRGKEGKGAPLIIE